MKVNFTCSGRREKARWNECHNSGHSFQFILDALLCLAVTTFMCMCPWSVKHDIHWYECRLLFDHRHWTRQWGCKSPSVTGARERERERESGEEERKANDEGNEKVCVCASLASPVCRHLMITFRVLRSEASDRKFDLTANASTLHVRSILASVSLSSLFTVLSEVEATPAQSTPHMWVKYLSSHEKNSTQVNCVWLQIV